MTLVRSPAVLLRAHAYGEGSRILRFLTRDLGVVGVMAKGSRRRGARGDGGLATFTEGDLTLYVRPNRDLQTLREFSPARVRVGLGSDFARLAGASLLAEIVIRAGAEGSAEELYDHVVDGFDRIEASPGEDLLATVLAMSWKLTAILGFAPTIDTCARCGQALTEEEVGRFVHGSGGVLCGSCGSAGVGVRVGPGARAQIRGLVEGRVVSLRRAGAHLRLLEDFLLFHLHVTTKLQSIRFLEPLADDGVEDSR